MPPFHIAQGSHGPEDGEACLMEWVSLFSEDKGGPPLTDMPLCTDFWFARFVQRVNDEIESNDVRASLAPLISRISKVKELQAPGFGRSTPQDTQMRVALSLFEYLASGGDAPKTSAVRLQESYVLFGIQDDLKEIISRTSTVTWRPRLLYALVALAFEGARPRKDRNANSALTDMVVACVDDEELVGLLHHALAEWERITGISTGDPLTETQLNTLNTQLTALKKEWEA